MVFDGLDQFAHPPEGAATGAFACVSNSPFTDTDSFTSLQHKSGVWSSHQTTAPNPFTLISAAGVQGRYLRVQLSTSDYLSLAEVQIFGAGDAPVPTLTAASSHTGHILQTGVYSVAVTNRGAAPTYGTLTVSDDSGGLIMGTVSGAGWTCTPAASSAMCTTNTALSGGLSSAPVSLNVSVPSGLLANTPEVTVTNTVTAGGGGAAGIATFSDPTLVGDYSPNVQPMTTVVENGVTKYQFTYTDADGFADIDHMQLMFNSSRAANSCWLVIDTAGNLYLADNN